MKGRSRKRDAKGKSEREKGKKNVGKRHKIMLNTYDYIASIDIVTSILWLLQFYSVKII